MATLYFDTLTIGNIRNLFFTKFSDLDGLLSGFTWNRSRIATMNVQDLESYKNSLTILVDYMTDGDTIMREFYTYKEHVAKNIESTPANKAKKQKYEELDNISKALYKTSSFYDGQTYNEASNEVKTVLAPALKLGMPRTSYYTQWVNEARNSAKTEYFAIPEVKKIDTFDQFVLRNIDGRDSSSQWSLDINISTAQHNNITTELLETVKTEIDNQITIFNFST